jgi:TolA-binding protein
LSGLPVGGADHKAAHAQPAGANLDEARARFDQLSRSVEELRRSAQELDRRHQALADQIAERKRGRDNAELVGDSKLKELLSQARGLADQLYQLQTQLHDRERRLEDARAEVLEAYEARIARLEDVILDPALLGQRDAAIQEMNGLRRARHAYLVPAQAASMPSAHNIPSARDIRDPEEALAVLAEVNDTDRRLLARVEELNRRISQMEAEQRLRRKARDFQERQAFFDDERTGGRRVASTSGGARLAPETTRDPATGKGSEASGGGTRDDSGNNSAPSNNGGAPLDSNAPDPALPEALPNDGVASESDTDDLGPQADPSTAPPSATVGGEVFVPSLDLPSDPFAAEGVVSQSDAEYLGAGAGRAEETGSLEDQLRKTKRERELLLRKSRELHQRAQDLKRLADDL